MSRKLKFDLAINANALLNPNPSEFYSKAYITEEIAGNYRTLPGIKYQTKIANILFTDILHTSTCPFVDDNSPLDAIDVDVCALSAMAEICRFDLEQSFVSLQMGKGDQGTWDVASFMAYYWDEMAKEIQDEIAQIRWQGINTAPLAPLTFLDLCDGYIVRMVNDPDIQVSSTGLFQGVLDGNPVSASFILTAMQTVYAALPGKVRANKSNLRFYLSSDAAQLYEFAAASANTVAFVTQPLDLTFLGVKIVVCDGMPASTMVLTDYRNLIYAFDGEGDSTALRAINLEDTVAEPKLRTRTNIKVGFYFTNPSDIIIYNNSPLIP